MSGSGWAPVRGARAAVVFLTRIPAGGFPYSGDELRWSAAHFPLVGVLVGALAAAVDRLLLPLGPLAAAAGALGASMLSTGAFHEDGLADTADALGGAHDREKILTILKDSRIGVFGACALGISLLGRAALVARLGDAVVWALPLAHAAARAAPVWQMATLKYVTPSATSRSARVAKTGWAQVLVASVWVIAAMAAVATHGWTSWARCAALGAGLAATAGVTAWRYKARLGGVTGDFLGATEQISEIVALGVLAWGHGEVQLTAR
jgi:adenosylcobinamide-GDP ribazoletransferase